MNEWMDGGMNEWKWMTYNIEMNSGQSGVQAPFTKSVSSSGPFFFCKVT